MRKAPMNRLAGPAMLVLACVASGSVFQSSNGAIKLEKVPLTMQWLVNNPCLSSIRTPV